MPLVGRYSEKTVPSEPQRSDFERVRESVVFPFDLFAALRYWLADEGNSGSPADAFDQHDRLRASASAQARVGATEIPLVNAYLLLLRAWLEHHLGLKAMPALPPGARAVVVLSHDVDRPYNRTDVTPILRLARDGLRQGRTRYSIARAGRTIVNALVTRVREPGARTWLFDEIDTVEQRAGARSSFYFGATPCLSARGHDLDVFYDVTRPEFRIVCRELRARGHDVGLHVGYNVGDRRNDLLHEKEIIEDVVGEEVVGCRHHYWHLGRPFWSALENHAHAGFAYDSSVAFNDGPGFRLGAALPFYPWDPGKEQRIETLQIAPVLMDNSLLDDGARPVDDAVEHALRLVDTLKQFEGTAAINWHQEGCLPESRYYRRWGLAYLALLEALAADPQIAFRTGREVTEAHPRADW